MADKPQTRRAKPARVKKPTFVQWSKVFLAELAATSNVTASAKKARIGTSCAYDARRSNAAFNRAWQQALCEGYDHLEMELLHRLRNGEVKPAAGARRGTRAFDNATAFRLLSAHRESAARFRAVRNNEDAEAIVLSINAKLEAMRQRRLALAESPDAANTVIDGQP
ncbi:MAG: hypothetical protein KGM18_11735 [Sphingomonadales bacterium]|nr:hypothetical protein [Sphingomonadales bacterium]